MFILMDLQDLLVGLLQASNKQWGKSTSTGEYVTHTFPIKFTVIPIVVAGALTSNTSGNTGSQSNPCYRSITVSDFVFCMYDNARGYAGSTYIAIGYQLQWGNSWSGYTGVFDWYFPINTSQVCAVCLTKHTQKVSSGHNWEPARIEQWSNSFVRIRPDGDLGYSVIVIGLA